MYRQFSENVGSKSHQCCKVLPVGVSQRHRPGCVPVFLRWYMHLRLVKQADHTERLPACFSLPQNSNLISLKVNKEAHASNWSVDYRCVDVCLMSKLFP